MGKTKKRQVDESELYALNKEIKDLRNLIKAYQRQVNDYEKQLKNTNKIKKIRIFYQIPKAYDLQDER